MGRHQEPGDRGFRHHRIERDRRRRSSRPELSSEQIVAAAIALADRQGLEAVTMRAVARALGAGAMSLYWHVRDKNELLQLMFEEIMRQASPPHDSSGDWREDLTSLAVHARANLLAHPWILDIVGSDTEGMVTPEAMIVRPGMLDHIETSMGKAASLPLDFVTRSIIAHMVDDFTLGFTAGEIQERRLEERSGLTEEQRREQVAPHVKAIVASGNFPHFTEYIKHDEELPSLDERFKIALEILLDGVAVQIERAGRT